MTDHDAELEQIARAANELVPELTERLRKSGLGELEVRSGSLRVRVAAAPDPSRPVPGGPRVVAASSSPVAAPGTEPSPSGGSKHTHGVTSPAVGFFA